MYFLHKRHSKLKNMPYSTLWHKEHPATPWYLFIYFLFVLAINHWTRCLSVKSGVFILWDSLGKKLIFHLKCSSIGDSFYVGVVTVSTSLLNSRTPSGENDLKFYAYCQSFSEFIYTQNLLCLEGLIPWCLHSLLGFELFSPCRDPWVLLRDIWWRHPFGAVCLKDSHSLHIVLLWVSVFVPIFYMNLVWKWLRNAQNNKFNRRSLKLILHNHI